MTFPVESIDQSGIEYTPFIYSEWVHLAIYVNYAQAVPDTPCFLLLGCHAQKLMFIVLCCIQIPSANIDGMFIVSFSYPAAV